MKRLLIICFILILLMNITVSASSVEDIMSGEENEVSRTVMSINESRKEIGLEPLVISDTLNTMALTHSKYQYYNDSNSSVEESDLLYYRGRYPWDRADYFQYEKNFVYEFVGDIYDNYLQGYMSLLNNPLTRPVLLNPMYDDVGMGTFEGKYTYLLGGNTLESEQSVIYPYNNQTNVEVSYDGELADLVNLDPEEENPKSGLPITYTYYGNDIENFVLELVYLRTTDRTDNVDVKILEPGYLPQMKNTVTAVPREPLAYGTEYRLTLKFKLEFEDGTIESIHEIIDFTTVESLAQTMAIKFVTRADFTERIMKNSKLDFDLIEPLEMKFSDVDIQSSNSIYIHTASELGIINGYPDGTFGPEWNITKQQAYKILIEAYEKMVELDESKNYLPIIVTTPESERLIDYSDTNRIASWARDAVEKADELGIIVAQDGYIDPTEFITDDEFDEMMARFNLKITAFEVDNDKTF